ncbi:MAG TPA: translocation/assembly module TamB domain-containing protein [Candidatus Binatia bacterium]|nr:translocation/assembly module TamB domain-containing protein [Candidatus Binatia bacterium]
MIETETKPARRRLWKYAAIFLGFSFLACVAMFIYINTESFQALVRRRLIAEVERITGGRVEIGSIHTTPFREQVDVRNITVHGRESASEIPLAHAERIVARLKLSSLLRSEFGFYEVILENPVVHVAFLPDGATNVPQRHTAAFAGNPVEQLFALSIDRFELRNGRIVWDDQSIPLVLDARHASLQMDYSLLHSRYDGRLQVAWVESKLKDCQPFAWMGNLEFSLGEKSANFPSVAWNSGHSHVHASGEVTDFRRPHLKGSYDAGFDLSEVAAITRRHDLRAGQVELKGQGDWSLERFSSSGLLSLRDLGWQNDQISFSKAAIDAGYSIDDSQLKISKLQARIFGGNISGEAEVNQWLAPAQHLSAAARKNVETATISAPHAVVKSPGNTAKPRSLFQSAIISLRLRNLSAGDLAVALNTSARNLPKYHPAGATSGTIEARWLGTPEDADIQFGLDVVPPDHPIPGELRVDAHTNGAYHALNHTLDLPRFTLTTPSSHIQATGSVSSASNLHLSIETSSLADWLPIVSAIRGPAIFPVALNGSASFTGTMTGSTNVPQFAGNLEVDDFGIDLAGSSHTKPFKTHWDSLTSSVQVSFNGFSLKDARLNRGDTVAEFEVSSALIHGHITPDTVFSLRAILQNADLDAIQALLGYQYPISGRADLFVQATGTPSEPHADGQIHLSNALAYGENIRQFDSAFHLARGRFSFDNLRLLHNDAVVMGSAAYVLSNRNFRLDLTGNNIDLSRVPQLSLNHFSLEGHADFSLKGSGTPESPSISGNIHAHNLTFDHELAGDFDVQAATRGKQLELTGESRFQRGTLKMNGRVQMREGYAADLNFELTDLDLDALWRSYLYGNLTGHSAVSGAVSLRGPFNRPAEWTLDSALNSVTLDVEHVKLQNQGPMQLAISNSNFILRQVHLVGNGTDLTARGTVQLSGDNNLDLAADGHADLALLSAFDSDFTSSGLVTLNMTVGGTYSDPLPQGSVQVTNGTLNYAGLPSGLTELTGSLTFTREHVHIDNLTARTGGGTVDLKGGAVSLDRDLAFSLTGTAKEVRLRYPPGVSSTADAELRWTGTRSASTVTGEVRINRMAVTPGFDFSSYLQRSRQLSTVTTPTSPLQSIKLDIHVQTAPELQMRTAVARLSGDADLHLRGSIANPALLGRIDILEGRATFHGTRFTLERGDITFTNPVAIEPQLNLQASTHVRNYDLNVTLTGTPNRGLNLNYRSEPPLPKSDIIALLALGRTSEESESLQEQSGQSTFSDQTTAAILNDALNSTVTSRVQRLFGASNIKIDPQGLTTETNPISNSPQITIEQQFANNLSLTYSTNVSQSAEQIIQGEYYFNRNLSLVGTRDQNGVVSFDVRLRRRKK